jgi:hypothetical protein
MKDKEITETIKELMEKYNEYKEKWMEVNGSDKGYNEWFTAQVLNS